MPQSVGSNEDFVHNYIPVNTFVYLADKPKDVSSTDSYDDSSKDWNLLTNSYFVNFGLKWFASLYK